MSTDHTPLDPTETDQSDLIIDPESITQWVDGTLPSPHKMSVDKLATKFPVLTKYKQDAEKLSALFHEAFSTEIVAPAHTVCRVMAALKKETGVEHAPQDADCREKTTRLTAEASPAETPENAPAEAEAPHAPHKKEEAAALDTPFVIHFPEQHKKVPRYLLPAAALLFLMALVGSIIHSERSTTQDEALAQKERHTRNLFPFTLKRHRSMDAGPHDPHSPGAPESRAHLTIYDTAQGQAVPAKERELSPKEEEEKKEQERKAQEKKKKEASPSSADSKSDPAPPDKTPETSR